MTGHEHLRNLTALIHTSGYLEVGIILQHSYIYIGYDAIITCRFYFTKIMSTTTRTVVLPTLTVF